MRWVMPLALFSLAAASDARAAVDVRLTADRVSVRADAAPLSEVLDRLAKQLGMKLIYEGAPPRGLVSAALENRTPAQAVIGVLEGTGVDYLARMDRTSTRVDTLIISSSSGSAGAAAGATPHPAVPSPAIGRAAAPPDEEEESIDEEDQPEEAPPPRPRPGQPSQGNEGDPRRPGAAPFMGRPPNGPGMQGLPSNPGMLAPGDATPRTYPVSPFAPVPPPPTTLPAPPPPAAAQGDDPEEE